MMLVAVFLVFFVVGPAMFWVLVRPVPSQRGLLVLAAFVAGPALAAVALRYGMTPLWGADLQLSVVGIALMWCAWIGALAFGAQALRRLDRGLLMRQWTLAIGALCTTVPWFGLASARMMGG